MMKYFTIKSPTIAQLKYVRNLWKTTFNDSDEYLDLIFDETLKIQYILCTFKEEKIISILIGIPFIFSNKKFFNSSECPILSGLYLCGLATDYDYRGEGIMSNMLINISKDQTIINNFDFLFLIPANDHLRNYYKHFDFKDSSFLIRYFVSSEIFKDLNRLRERSEADIVIIDNLREFQKWSVEKIIEQAQSYEISVSGISIIHNHSFWNKIIKEKFQSGSIFIAEREDKLLKSLFCIQEDGEIIKFFGSIDEYKIIDKIISIHSNTGKSIENSTKEKVFRSHKEKYGMIKFLPRFFEGKYEFSQGSENPIFENLCGNGNKFSNLKKSEFLRLQEMIAQKIHIRLLLD